MKKSSNINLHTAYRFEKKGADTVVIFIHGIIEGPNQFEDFIEQANERVSLVNLLLPGHGGSGKVFANSSMKEWQSCVFNKVKALEQNYDHIILVGHSMGALLAIEAAIKYPVKIKELILLTVPVCIRLRHRGMINGLKVALDLVKEDDIIAIAVKRAYSIERQPLLSYLRWMPRYIELFKKVYEVRGRLDELKLPVFVYQSAQDEFVSLKSLKYLKTIKNVKMAILEHSGHFYYLPEERKKILSALEELIIKNK